MPLHLLPKKSWNVYNPQNILRVQHDEAAAAAHSSQQDHLLQSHDAACRLALLRGQSPPPPPAALDSASEKPHRGKEESPGKSERRKKRKLQGEDDTDRDIRVARADREVADEARVRLEGGRYGKSAGRDAPLYDGEGHIDLFPVEARKDNRVEGNVEAEREKRRKEREVVDQYTMRFSNAAGRDVGVGRPWYAGGGGKGGVNAAEEGDAELALVESKNVWGREDLGRKGREKARIDMGDPLASMKKAQVQLKQSEGDKRRWKEERARELEGVVDRREKDKGQERRKHRREDREDADELTGFSLDATAPNPEKNEENRESRPGRKEKGHRHRHHHRSRRHDASQS